ncbi:hypothetical protein SM097_004097 [Cronobacter sakazakii]|nr:hypothetical protein [Cronobacter sakazakii]
MKLIDLLVQELPKRGGWPECCHALVQGSNGAVYLAGGGRPLWKFYLAEDWELEEVTREQYEAALAAAQQPVWDGEGLPPVSYECEAKYRLPNAEWFIFRCVGIDCGVAFGWAGKEAVTLDIDSYEFRPIRPEADTKREIGVIALATACGDVVPFKYGDRYQGGELVGAAWYELYDKIAAGEVAGIRIE